MDTMNAIIYDCEIEKCVPQRGVPNDPRFDYCEGWDDHANMGITCIGVWDYQEQCSRVFLADELREFAELVRARDHIIGFNSIYFDDLLCRANGIEITTTYDVLVEVRRATGQPDAYVPRVTRAGYALENLAQSNLGVGKTGNGALAPMLWQEGKHEEVIEYCRHDVVLTKRLLESWQHLKDPNDGHTFMLRRPPMLGSA